MIRNETTLYATVDHIRSDFAGNRECKDPIQIAQKEREAKARFEDILEELVYVGSMRVGHKSNWTTVYATADGKEGTEPQFMLGSDGVRMTLKELEKRGTLE